MNLILLIQGDVEIFRQERVSVQTIIPLAHQIVFTYETTSPITTASFEIDDVSFIGLTIETKKINFLNLFLEH